LAQKTRLKCQSFATTNATALLHCRPRTSPGTFPFVETHPHFGLSGYKSTAEERPTPCNRLGWGLDYLEITITAKWNQALEQINCLLSAVSRCRILLEAEEIFNDGQKFLHEENFVVVQTIYFQTSIDETKTRALQCWHSGRHRLQTAECNKRLGAMSFQLL